LTLKAVQLDLARYRQPLTHVVKTFQPADAGAEGEAYRVVEPVELEFDLHKDKERFRLEGTVRTVLELPCSRCLEPFRLPVDAALDLRYYRVGAVFGRRAGGRRGGRGHQLLSG
jgi:uncharacterized metal-binding protein YceD (DUF177 family)